MRRLATILMLFPLPLVAQERATLGCVVDGAPPFEVTLWNPSEHDVPLHCVNAPELAELFPCAPDGGWGLTDPSRPGELERVESESTAVRGHEGSKLFARVTLSEFVASASQGRELPLALDVAGETFWRMRITLESGQGLVETLEGEAAVACDPL